MKAAGTMKAVKWLGMDKDGKMTVSPAAAVNVLRAMPSNQNVNLISIFGAARQGKSFLMNLLANQQDLFRISNEKEPCTQGVDLSSHFMPLEEFSRINGCQGVSSNLKVGFVDAEGQGDRDITYDSRLVSPVLLSSKVVIFNWKDTLQADRMLNLLAVLAKAAQNVELAEGESRKVFGHLHIVFRDWNFINTNPTEVYDTLFKKEKGVSKEISNRNLARHELVDAFESISIWLFPLPVVSTAQLSEKIRFEQLQPTFQNKLRELRTALSSQLKAPMVFNQQPLTGPTLAEIMPFLAESLNDNQVIMPESIYSSMRRAEGKKLQTSIEQEMRDLCEALLSRDTLVSADQFKSEACKGLDAIFHQAVIKLRAFPEDIQRECQAALKARGEQEIDLATKKNNEKIFLHFQSILNSASEELDKRLKTFEAQLPLAPRELERKCEDTIRDAVLSIEKCPKSPLINYSGDVNRLKQQGALAKERLQHLNDKAIRIRWSKIQSQVSQFKNDYKTKGVAWLDKRISSNVPFTVTMLEEELQRSRSSLNIEPANPDLDEYDVHKDLVQYHEQVLEDLKRQYTLHVRNVLVQFIASAKSKLDSEMQAIVLPMPEDKLRSRIYESKERVVLDIANEMQGWSFPEEDTASLGASVAEYTDQMVLTYSKKNEVASKDVASRKAAALYNEAKDNLIKHLHATITKAIPLSESELTRMYEASLVEASAKLGGSQKKQEQTLQSLRGDLATMIEQLRTINRAETEKLALQSEAEKERQRLKVLTEKVHETHAQAAQQEREMKQKLQEMESKSSRLKNELSSQASKSQDLERQLQEWQQKSQALAEEKKRVEAEARQMAHKERQAANRQVQEYTAKQQQMQDELQAIQRQLEQQQRLLQAKDREVQEAEAAKEQVRKLALEKEKALQLAEQERAMREKLSQDVLLHQQQKARTRCALRARFIATLELESKISSVLHEKSVETQKLQGALTSQQRKAQEMEEELQRLKQQAAALDKERDHWRRQVMAMEESKQVLAQQVNDESARREAAEAAAQQAARAAEVAAKAALEAAEVTPEKKRKSPKVSVPSSSAKKARKLEVKDTLPKVSLQEAKRLAQEEMAKRIDQRISKMKK